MKSPGDLKRLDIIFNPLKDNQSQYEMLEGVNKNNKQTIEKISFQIEKLIQYSYTKNQCSLI